MSSCCRSVDGEVLVFACAGAAYCVQLTNRAALDLTKEGVAQMFCLSAIAAGKEDKLVRTRGAGMRIALDGCEDHCARRVLETAGVRPRILSRVGGAVLRQPGADFDQV